MVVLYFTYLFKRFNRSKVLSSFYHGHNGVGNNYCEPYRKQDQCKKWLKKMMPDRFEIFFTTDDYLKNAKLVSCLQCVLEKVKLEAKNTQY